MNIVDLQNDKFDLIAWISQREDASLIEKLKALRSQVAVPQSQQNEVYRRLDLIEKGEMKTRSWKEAKNDIFKK